MHRRFSAAAIAFFVCVATTPSFAAGLYVAEFATTDMGAAGSGSLARGDDAASGVQNPAAMTRLDSHQLHLGLAPGISVVEFDPDPDTPVAGGDGGNQGGLIPLMSTGYVHKISDRFRAGLGVYSISGASLDPNNNWAGRNQVTEITLLTVSLLPSVAVRVTDWLSVGAGPFITYATLDWKLRAPLPGPGNNEGSVRFDKIDDTKVAAVVGLLLEPRDDLRVGLLYQSKTDLELEGDVRLPGSLGPVDVRLELPLAQAVRGDVHWQVTKHLALSAGGAWENWDELEDTTIGLGSSASSVRLGFKDTWKVRGGVHYQLTERLMVQTGLSYDSSALRNRDRTPALPIDEQWRLGFGAVYDWSADRSFGVSFQYTNLGKSKVNNSALKGDYRDNNIFFLQMSVAFKKLPWDGWASL